MSLTLAVAAKGHCQPQGFFAALGAAGMLDMPEVEVIIAHDETWPMLSVLPGNVRLCACPRGTSILKLWGIAMAQGMQPFVAALDIHCPPQAAWWARVRQEIKRGTAVFFGPVNPGWDGSDVRNTGYIAEYFLENFKGQRLAIKRGAPRYWRFRLYMQLADGSAVPRIMPHFASAKVGRKLPAVYGGGDNLRKVLRLAENDLEAEVARRHPEIATCVKRLADSGARIARMSGSGSTVFGIFERRGTELSGLPEGVRIVLTRTATSVQPVRLLD